MSINIAQYPTSVWDASSPVRSNDRQIDRDPDFEDWDQIVAELIATQTEIDIHKYISIVSAHSGTMVAGSPVYPKASGAGLELADRDASAPAADCIGLLTADCLTSGIGKVQLVGDLTLTTAQWDAVTGGTGGLVVNTSYYLDTTAGKITATRPSTTVSPVTLIGIARSTTRMKLIPKMVSAIIS